MDPCHAYLVAPSPDPGPTELLALVLGGRHDARRIARELLDRHGSLAGIANASPRALARVPGVGPVRAVRIHAALVAGRRSAAEASPERDVVRSAADAWVWFGPRLGGLDHEELHALLLDARNRVVGYREVTRGSERATLVQPRQIARLALEARAHAVVLAHNHPSGDPEPSPEDLDVTRRVADGIALLEIRLLDHLVVAGDRYVALAERGGVPPYPSPQRRSL